MLGINYGRAKMRTNDCPKCGARNTLKSTICGNCGADITLGGKVKYNIKYFTIVIIILFLLWTFGK